VLFEFEGNDQAGTFIWTRSKVLVMKNPLSWK